MEHGGILIISGTNRPGSNAEKVARVIEGHYRELNTPVDFLALTEMGAEIFEPGAYQTKPASMMALQGRVLSAAGLHIITPEYNGSFPGALKYFIDMLKFPESFDGKPVAFVGESGGTWGALRAVEQLQGIFGYRNAHIYRERVFIPNIRGKFHENGRLNDAEIDGRLAKQVKGFSQFIDRLRD